MHETFVEVFNEMLPEEKAVLLNLAERHSNLIQEIDRAFIEMSNEERELLKSLIGRSLERELFRDRRKRNEETLAYAGPSSPRGYTRWGDRAPWAEAGAHG